MIKKKILTKKEMELKRYNDIKNYYESYLGSF